MEQGHETGKLTVAFATTNLKDIDAHFGSTKQFYVYDITKTDSSLLRSSRSNQKIQILLLPL